MFNKKEIKEFIIKFGRRVLFPDVSNVISKRVLTVGIGIVIGINPYSILFLNWLIDLFNKNNVAGYQLSHFDGGKIDYAWGVVLIICAIVHNAIYQYIKFSQDRAESKNKHEKEMAEEERAYKNRVRQEELEVIQQNKRIDADRRLFESFSIMFPSDSNSAVFLKEHDFGVSFHMNRTKQIEEFVDTWNMAETKFLDDEIEKAKEFLRESCKCFIDELFKHYYSILGGPTVRVIPDAYVNSWDLPDFIQEHIRNLNKRSYECYELHQEFVFLCRKKLKL
ncbi:hypothetical protein JY459_19145 [Serratia marcescens]|nr:hypothetical protein [Serratia marcescens]